MEGFDYEMAMGRAKGKAASLGLETLDQEWTADGLDVVCGLVLRDPKDGSTAFVDVAFDRAEPGAKAYLMPQPTTTRAEMGGLARRWFAERGERFDPERTKFDSVSILDTGTGKVLMRWAHNAL